MHDDVQLLEDELRRRRPRSLSPELVARIGRELTPVRPRHSRWRKAWWAFALPLAAAASLALAWLGGRRLAVRDGRAPAIEPGPVTATDVLKPVAIENVLYSARNEGLVVLTDGTPARRQRLQFVDTITWKNPASNVSITWTVPREEIRVVRVVYQ